jgi:hypothetical protein
VCPITKTKSGDWDGAEVTWAEVERYTTIAANVVTIVAFFLSLKPVTRYAANVRRDLTEIRRDLENPGTRASEDVVHPFAQILLRKPVDAGAGRWEITWTWAGGEATSEARITAVGLRRRLQSDPSKFEGRQIVGEVRYALRDGAAARSDVEVPVVHYVTHDWLSAVAFWLRKPFL